MKLEKKPANGPNMIPVRGSDMKIQLYQTPEKGKGGPTNESQTTLNAAKTATNETKAESFSFFNKAPGSLLVILIFAFNFKDTLCCEHLYVLLPVLGTPEQLDEEDY